MQQTPEVPNTVEVISKSVLSKSAWLLYCRMTYNKTSTPWKSIYITSKGSTPNIVGPFVGGVAVSWYEAG